MGIKFIVISVQVSYIIGYLEDFLKTHLKSVNLRLYGFEIFYHNIIYKSAGINKSHT